MRATIDTRLAGLLAIFAAVVLATAWLCDDAYITFRTIENFNEGYGLRWNVTERVQVYTHPLWMFLLGAVYSATHEIYYTTVFTSVAVSVASVALLLFGIARSAPAALLAGGAVVFARSFTDFSTSGLENPLTHLLMAAFCLALFRSERERPLVGLLASIACLGTLNRLDSLLLYLPPLAVVAWSGPRWRNAGAIAAGFLPLALWEAFSLVYYGFPFPNTAYAKLQTGIDGAALAMQGLRYLAHSLRADPVTPLAILLAAAATAWRRSPETVAILAGVAAHLAYTVAVGGDFMSGRFLTPAVFGAAVLIARADAPALGRPAMAAGALALAATGFGSAGYRAWRGDAAPVVDAAGVADERRAYAADLGLWNVLRRGGPQRHPWARKGLELREKGEPVLQIAGGVGLLGYYAGPEAHILDVHGLSDPFLARLPAEPGWRIGHFVREPRADYVDSLRAGSNRIVDPEVARYVEALFVITRGDLFDRARLRTIVDFNLGRYDRLLDGWLKAKAARRAVNPPEPR